MSRLSDVSLHALIQEEHIKTETGAVLDFRKYRFMFDIYADRSAFICAMKAAQIGFTTYEILKSLHEAKTENTDIIYVLPTADDVNQFSGAKTNRILMHNPELQSWTRDKDSIEQKRVGNATIYYRGSLTERPALMIYAHKLIVDENDRCKPEIVEQYDSRLQATTNPKKAFFSNPSSPGFGIDKIYRDSDQKKWHITHSCGKTYAMEEECVDYASRIYRCPFCKKEITDEERRMGNWKPTAKGKWSGYWIPLWITPWTPASKIADYKREKTAEYFYNFVAGLPYAGSGDTIRPSDILACVEDETNGQEGMIAIGVDTGLPIHVVVANQEGFFWYGTLPESNPYLELEKILLRWKDAIIVADQGGDLIGIRDLQAKYMGKVFLCFFRPDAKNLTLATWGEGDEYGKVIADRNRSLQLFVDEHRDRRVRYQGTKEDWKPYSEHWGHIYRVWQENSLQQRIFKWERNGPDHFVFAALYARIGLDRLADKAIVGHGSPLAGIRRGDMMREAPPMGYSPADLARLRVKDDAFNGSLQ